jgi:phosphoribosylformimino-5-aminoimidazole carboxamide ribotide isomerase
MMLIIPAIDIRGGRCVRLTQGIAGTETVFSENPVEMARHWETEGAQRLHIVDLDGAFTGQPQNGELIRRMVGTIKIPAHIAGGIRTLNDIKKLSLNGKSYVVLGTKVVLDPNFTSQACATYPGRVLIGIDSSRGRVAIRGWTEVTDRPATDLAREVEGYGAAGIIFTDIERDGMLRGPNLTAIEEMARSVRIPVIASGGITSIADLRALKRLEPIGVSGAVIGKALYTGAIRLGEALAVQ